MALPLVDTSPQFSRSPHLDSLPPEILDSITRRMEPHDIARLCTTGAPSLDHRLAHGGVTEFVLQSEVSGDRRWPTIVSRFRRLRTLVVSAPFGVSFRGIHLESLSSTIRHIKFEFNEAESCWYLPPFPSVVGNYTHLTSTEPEMMDVKRLFPELESLELAGTYHVSNRFVSCLPPSLHYLSIQTIDDLRPPGTPRFFDSDGLQHLPRHLGSLSIQGYLPLSPEDVSKIPRSVTSLRLLGASKLDDESIAHLPRELQHLAVSFSGATKISNVGLSLLPANLTSLDLRKNEKLTSSCFEHLPQRLTALQIGGPNMNIAIADGKRLPRGLTTLNLSNVHIEGNKVTKTLPRALSTLIIVLRGESVSSGMSSFIPRTVTHLYVSKMDRNASSWDNSFIEALTTNQLKFLHLSPAHSIDNAAAPRLPVTLISLDLGNANMNYAAIPLLPRGLTKLNIRHWRALNDESLAQLPRGLDSLALIHSDFVSDEAIASLPPNLTHLELRTSFKLTDSCIPLLPKGLRSLHLNGSYRLTDACIRALPPNITSLRISDHISIHRAEPDVTPLNPPAPAAPRDLRASPSKSLWQSVLSWVSFGASCKSGTI